MNKVKEGLTEMTTVDLKVTTPVNEPVYSSPVLITKLEIIHNGGSNWAAYDDYLNLSEITIKDINGVVIPYSTSNSLTATNKGYVSLPYANTNNSRILNNDTYTYGLQNLYDNNKATFFHSRYITQTLEIQFFEPQNIGSILIRNRLDCEICLKRIDGYRLRLYSNTAIVLTKLLGDSALQSGVVPDGTKNEYKFSNVITYNIIQPSLSAGPAGPTGPAGAAGAAGPAGFTGPAGIDGRAGSTGIAGPAGPAGIAGVRGTEGPIGPTGPAGIDGIDGINGSIGSNGQGPQGISRENEYSYFGASSIQTIENFSIMESLSEPMACLSSPASYM